MQLGSSKDSFPCFTRLNPCIAHCSTDLIPWVHHSREEGSIDYDGGFVRLQIHMKFDMNIHRQQFTPDCRKKDSIWVIVDRLTKTAHFIVVHTTYSVQQYEELYMDQIVRLHGVSKTIISDRGTQFVARFWEQLHECLGTKLIRSSSYHSRIDGQTERVNQILEDMLRESILHFDKS
jgi:transposase InsO family protein